METAGKHVCPQTLSLTGRFGEPQHLARDEFLQECNYPLSKFQFTSLEVEM